MTNSGMPFSGHLDRVGVSELVWREPAADAGRLGGVVQLHPDAGGSAWPAAGGAAQNAEQCADGQIGAELEPGIETFPTPAVHPDLAALAAFPGADQQRAPVAVKVGLGQSERFADPQPGTPEHDDHAAQPYALCAVAGGAHHGDDLLDRGWIGGVAHSFVSWWAALVKAGEGRGRAAPAGTVEQRRGFHLVLLETTIDMPIVACLPRRMMIIHPGTAAAGAER